jgi:hypothetical protein
MRAGVLLLQTALPLTLGLAQAAARPVPVLAPQGAAPPAPLVPLQRGKRSPVSDTSVPSRRPSEAVKFETDQVRDKFKHASDFGVTGNSNPSSWRKLTDAMRAHIDAPGTQAITGTYRGNPVIHHLDPSTGLNVMTKPSGEFISGWKLSPDQLKNVVTRGSL